MRQKIIAGNWKMYKTAKEAAVLASEILKLTRGIRNTEIVLCPPMTALDAVYAVIKDSNIKLGAQNVHWASQGAYTGEVSGKMLKEAGCEYAIVGHSERRLYFREDDYVRWRIGGAIDANLKPIFCIGESLDQRENAQTYAVIEKQIFDGLRPFTEDCLSNFAIAYEPVWAIGTGKNATPQEAEESHSSIRKTLAELFSQKFAEGIRIQYGGSVNRTNAADLLKQPNVDGALVGGASLEAANFADIVKEAESLSSNSL